MLILGLKGITFQFRGNCNEEEVQRTMQSPKRATCLIKEFTEGLEGQVITKLTPAELVRVNPVKRIREECFEEREWHMSQFRGESTIFNSAWGNRQC